MDENIVSLPEKRLQKRFALPQPPKPEPVCPRCKCPLTDTSHGWVREDRWHEHNEKCIRLSGYCQIPCPLCSGGVEAKRQAQLINELFGDAHIPWYARDWNFDTYPAHGDQNALEEVKAFVRFSLAGTGEKRGLYLSGANGLCKTSLAISALQHVIRKGKPGCFITTKELFALAKEAIGAERRIMEGDAAYEDRYTASRGAKLYRMLKAVEWVVLDDLGVECGTKYEIGELYLIIEARRSQGLYTLFTSNRDAKDLHLYWRHAREGVYEDSHRVIDRLGEMCFVIPVTGVNHRLQQKGGHG
jgi:DNA replication protein DnaC